MRHENSLGPDKLMSKFYRILCAHPSTDKWLDTVVCRVCRVSWEFSSVQPPQVILAWLEEHEEGESFESPPGIA